MPKNKNPRLAWLFLQKALRILQPKPQGTRQSPNKKGHYPWTILS
jgi:hypothetical protein